LDCFVNLSFRDCSPVRILPCVKVQAKENRHLGSTLAFEALTKLFLL
jgi:hypothetical protein